MKILTFSGLKNWSDLFQFREVEFFCSFYSENGGMLFNWSVSKKLLAQSLERTTVDTIQTPLKTIYFKFVS